MGKTVKANQAAINALPDNSGEWRVEKVQGLTVRCRGDKRTFLMIRKLNGKPQKRTLKETTLADAKAVAARIWDEIAAQSEAPKDTFAAAYAAAMQHRPKGKDRSPKSVRLYDSVWRHHLEKWVAGRTLAEIGADLKGVEKLQQSVRNKVSKATANTTIRLLSLVYRHAWRRNPKLPAPPTMICELDHVAPRNWALTPEELKKFWTRIQAETKVQRMFWIVTMLSAARVGSVIPIEWEDVDFENRILFFRRAKGERVYRVPMADALVTFLREYRDSFTTLGKYVLPGRNRTHIVEPRGDGQDLPSPHHFRHTARTRLTILGAPTDIKKLLLGHSLTGSVSDSYVTVNDEVIESMRPWANKLADALLKIATAPNAAAV